MELPGFPLENVQAYVAPDCRAEKTAWLLMEGDCGKTLNELLGAATETEILVVGEIPHPF